MMVRNTLVETAAGVTVQATIETTRHGGRQLRLTHDATTLVYQIEAADSHVEFAFEARYEHGRLTAASPGDTTRPAWATAVLAEFETSEVAR